MSKTYDDGVAYCASQPDLMVAAVWQEARMHYQNLVEQTEFVNGYISERRRRDERREHE